MTNTLRDRRTAKNLKQIELAELAGVTLKAIQAYEQGYRPLGGYTQCVFKRPLHRGRFYFYSILYASIISHRKQKCKKKNYELLTLPYPFVFVFFSSAPLDFLLLL